jgi:hypothetical protein
MLMSLRSLLIAPLLVFLSLAVTLAAEYPKDRFTSGVWQGEANYDEEGYFSDCTMTTQADSKILLGFVISKDYDWGLVIADETRVFEVGARKAVLLLVDGHAPIAAIAKVVDVHGILIPLENSDAVIETLREGKVLRIATAGTEFSFKLTGTQNAIAALAHCVSEHEGSTRVDL